MYSKKDYDKKIREEQEATAHVFQEFITTFQNSTVPNKAFLKSGVFYADKNVVEKPKTTQIYLPKPLAIQQSEQIKNAAVECAKILKDSNSTNKVSKKHEKKKSNLELLKEELKQRHSERDERERLKEEYISAPPALNYFDGGDPKSTNLFVANLNPKVTENDLLKEFGAYGPLASVKIMWPRGEDRLRSPSTNCGFVAYMSRKDADRALRDFKHRSDMRVGWGKSVELPTHPAYIPDELLKLYLPPPQSGLPFNAQPFSDSVKDTLTVDDTLLYHSAVKVTIPLNKKSLALVNRFVEYVVKEGPLFEAMIMTREFGNPEFNFLFEYKSPVHIYYRWKLFSILNGDSAKTWRMAPFRMFRDGSVWVPPTAPNYADGMPEELIKKLGKEASKLSDNQCDRLIDLIQNLTMHRLQIAEAMVFCLNHFGAIQDALEVIVESLVRTNTNIEEKIGRLYLLSDVFSNCRNKEFDFGYWEKDSSHLEEVFRSFRDALENLEKTSERESFKLRIMRVLRHWDITNMFSVDFIKKLESYFLVNNTETDDDLVEEDDDDEGEPLDGANLLKRSLKVPTTDDCVIAAKKVAEDRPVSYFVPSKWDTIEAEEVLKQGMSSTEVYYMELEADIGGKLHKQRKMNQGSLKADKLSEEDLQPKRHVSRERSRKERKSRKNNK